jgi:hypothetical protein
MKDDGQMDDASEWSPDAPLGTETFEQGDEATEEEDRLHPDFDEQLAADPGLDPGLLVDERALEELGSELDDPEGMGTLDGGGDDPSGRWPLFLPVGTGAGAVERSLRDHRITTGPPAPSPAQTG